MSSVHLIYFIMNITIVHLIFFIALVRSESQARTSFFFTISSGQNSTGHRHVKTVCNIPAPSAGVKAKTVDDFRLDVQQMTHFVENVKYLQLTALFNVLDDERRPPPGYELVPGLGWYRLHLTPLTWEEARLACEAEGAHLAVFNSQKEADALKKISDRAPSSISGATWSSAIFIGYSDRIEGKHVTIFGQTLAEAGYSKWRGGEPNNSGGAGDQDSDCGAVERPFLELNDLPCSGKLAYFCEYEL